MKTSERPLPERDDDEPGYAERDDEETSEQTGAGVKVDDDDDRWAIDEDA
jgi:hypothetical protein